MGWDRLLWVKGLEICVLKLHNYVSLKDIFLTISEYIFEARQVASLVDILVNNYGAFSIQEECRGVLTS